MPRTREDTIKTKIELSGEKAYKQACSQINAELRELSSEMKLLSSQYDDNADSTEALRKQQDLYTRQMGEQQKKIDAAQKALKELEEAGNGSTEAARRMRIEINKNQSAYNETAKKVKNLADKIDDSEAEYKQYVQAAKDVDDTLDELSSEMKLLAEETRDSADSAETLRKKHNGLEKVFREQEKKVSALEKAYAAAAKDGDRLGKESHDIKIALNEAKTAASQTEAEMRDLERAMDSAGDAADDADDNFSGFGDILGKFGSGGLGGKLDDTIGNFSNLGSGIIGALGGGSLFAGVIGGIGAAILEAGKYVVDVGEENKAAMIAFSTQTGIAAEETGKYKDLMQDLYTSGYGENMEDIANAMAKVAQTTGELDPEKLGDMAAGALTLRDTFDIDIAESIRGVNQLMNAFGVDGARAIDMIALASQMGLNQNDNLLDTLNEYAVHYQQLGLSVEDMFVSLATAQKSGVFDIDKAGDAIKEFGIRVREGGDDVREAFTDMGLNADDMVTAFNTGGEAAAGALDQVLDALFSIEDETIKNQMGVTLFGTMWEDLGATGVEAATNVGASMEQIETDGTTAGNNINTAFQSAKGTLDNINNQKFDTLSGQIDIFGRNIKTEFESVGTYISDQLTDALKEVNEFMFGGDPIEYIRKKIVMTYGTWRKDGGFVGSAAYGGGLLMEMQGFEPFKIPVVPSFEEKSFAETLGIIQKKSEKPIIMASKQYADSFEKNMYKELQRQAVKDWFDSIDEQTFTTGLLNRKPMGIATVFEKPENTMDSLLGDEQYTMEIPVEMENPQEAYDAAFDKIQPDELLYSINPDLPKMEKSTENAAQDLQQHGSPLMKTSGDKLGGSAAEGMENSRPKMERAGKRLADGGKQEFLSSLPEWRSAGIESGMITGKGVISGFESMEGELATSLQAVINRVVSQISATVQVSAVVGAAGVLAGQTIVNVNQNIHAENTSYAQQQRQAAKSVGNVVRRLLG